MCSNITVCKLNSAVVGCFKAPLFRLGVGRYQSSNSQSSEWYSAVQGHLAALQKLRISWNSLLPIKFHDPRFRLFLLNVWDTSDPRGYVLSKSIAWKHGEEEPTYLKVTSYHLLYASQNFVSRTHSLLGFIDRERQI